MDLEEVIRRQIRIKLLIASVFIIAVSFFYIINNSEKNITGNPIIEPWADPESGCSYGGATYGGSYLDIINPQNNSYTGENFTFTVKTDYYGSDIETICEGYEPENCTLKIIYILISDDEKIIEPTTIDLPKNNEGNKTYIRTEVSSNPNYQSGNYSMKTTIKYTCEAEEFKRDDRRVKVHLDAPVITEIYPTNNLIINIANNSSTTINPKLVATDTLGILNRTVFDGSNTVSLIDRPNYNVTLAPGKYTWNFTATDNAGNKKIITSSFAILNSSANNTEAPVSNQTNQTVNSGNTTIYFESATRENNAVINSSMITVKASANTLEENTNLTITIYDSTGKVSYQNSTNQKSLEVSYRTIVDDTYYYNATVSYGNETKSTETRKITIDTESPTIEITSAKKTNFTEYVILEFEADDSSGIVKRWINDGTKNIDYNSKINKTLPAGEYTWTLYAQDKAGNIAKETFRFSIVKEEANQRNNTLAIFIIVIAVILLVIMTVLYFLKKRESNQPPAQNQITNTFPPANPSNQFSNLSPTQPQNPGIFKNNQFQR